MEEINYGVKGGNTPKQKVDLGFEIIFYALNFLAVPFSAVATFNGYKDSAGGVPMAAILAAITAVLFFGLNYMIKQRRINGQPHFKQTLGYLFPLAISFLGNFSYFYGNQVIDNQIKEEISTYSKVLDKTYTSATAAIDSSTRIDVLKLKASADLGQLKLQSSKTFGYWGDTSEAQWKRIQNDFENEYNVNLTNYTTTNKKNKYNQVETIINEAVTDFENSKNLEINNTKNQIEAIYIPLDTLRKHLSKSGNKSSMKNLGEGLINDIAKGNDKIIQSTQTKVSSYKSSNLLPFTSIKDPIMAMEHAWKNKTTSFAPAQSLFFSLIIDLVTLGFIFLAFNFSKKTGKRKGNTGINTLN